MEEFFRGAQREKRENPGRLGWDLNSGVPGHGSLRKLVTIVTLSAQLECQHREHVISCVFLHPAGAEDGCRRMKSQLGTSVETGNRSRGQQRSEFEAIEQHQPEREKTTVDDNFIPASPTGCLQ